MGTCGNKRSTLTKSVLDAENKNKSETLKLEQPKNEIKDNKNKGIELKESKTLKEEVVEPNIDLRKSQTQNYGSKEEKDLKDSTNLINSDLFEKPINIYTEPGKPHPPFEIINKQLEVSLCRITNKNNKVGIGFFCAIPFPTFHDKLPVLITNNYVLEKDEISPGKKLNITLNSKKKIELLLDDSRKIYNKNEIIIIEINEKDGLDVNNFLIFTNINNVDAYRKLYSPQNPYFFRYSKNDKIDCCLGLLQNIDKYNYKFMFSVDPLSESSGSPIISIEHDVIGIHMKEMKGVFLLEHLREFYEMESIKKNPKDEITIIYQIIKELDTKINIFGKTFVENNKDKCKIIINGKEQELVECLDNQNYSDIFNFKGKYTEISIKLKGINKITNASYMFKNCVALIALPDLGKWDTSKVTSMEGMFGDCWTLIYISNNLSEWNTSTLTTIYGMFVKCIYLIYLPDV
jgi:surface protein